MALVSERPWVVEEDPNDFATVDLGVVGVEVVGTIGSDGLLSALLDCTA